MRFVALAAWIAIGTAGLAGQQVHKTAVSDSCATNVPEYKQWLQTTPLTEGQQYVADSRRKNQIVEGYTQLKVGMTSRQVASLLGTPDFGVSFYGDETSTTPSNECAREVAYILWKKTDRMLDGRDFAIHVFFTPQGKLSRASPWNIPSLKPVGAPKALKL
jgi:hypothetical protein